MSHQLNEERKEKGNKVYYLNISYSGGQTHAEITVWNKKTKEWGVRARETGRGAAENVLFTWKYI